ncbi:AraC family transcriptional regulator, partial [Bacillus velezensis]|nr:AraC family transcriptional regulator [Bacillus velezensis]
MFYFCPPCYDERTNLLGGVYMELNHLVTDKIALNQYVHRLEQKDVSFYVHYWGAM